MRTGEPAATPRPVPPGLSAGARAVWQRCPTGAPDRTACLDAAVRDLLGRDGWPTVWRVLSEPVAAEPALQPEAHVVAHGLGAEAYRIAGSVAGAFRLCTPAFWSGCYHGALQAHFARWAHSGDVPAAELDGVCRPLQTEARWLWFQCLHGLGHGVTIAAGYELGRALALCGRLADPWAREICYGGVFMEDWVGRPGAAAAHDHGAGHAPGGAAPPGAGHVHQSADHGGHAHHPVVASAGGEAPTASGITAIDTTDLAHPCSAVATRYERACYLFQTSRVLARTGGDFTRVTAFCAATPAHVRPLCYQSLGRDADAYGGGDDMVRARCVAAGDGAAWCHVGVAKNRVHDRHDPRAGLAYCAALPADEATRTLCGAAVGEEVRLFAELVGRAPLCASDDEAVTRGCRFAAGLERQRPAALPRYPVRP